MDIEVPGTLKVPGTSRLMLGHTISESVGSFGRRNPRFFLLRLPPIPMQPVDTVPFDPHTEPLFWIGPAIVEPPLHQIRLGGRTHKLEPRVMRVLLCLAARPGHPVTRDDLLDAVWTDALPNDEGLTQAVCKLRKAFGDRATHATVIETIPKVGYRLIAPVSAKPIVPNGEARVSSNGQAQSSSNGHAKIASNGQAEKPEAGHARRPPPRPPLPASTFGLGYRQTEWRWLAVCFALLIVFCAMWASYVARPAMPAEQQHVFIHRIGSGPDATAPQGKMRIMVRKYQAPMTWEQEAAN